MKDITRRDSFGLALLGGAAAVGTHALANTAKAQPTARFGPENIETARVAADGNLDGGTAHNARPGVKVGVYSVIFGQKVNKSTICATITDKKGEIIAAPHPTAANTIIVETFDSLGGEKPRAFNILLIVD